ncbi:hypothetical protein LOTGIDRAFT_166733 [Lottia gigantea]|uniref:Serine protease n=1 Tax=Lottia gigantea TaxID=225164 RepID=V3Z826_LOTGI|nr:hypothetical protein LOTGIDRAFT_166733 [Lottia gigantea]ESO86998.1 hypothetical protein LOTGIDRAFT_166733 [Lottia gigantea]
MARCYHDQQDFISDLKIEVAREGDILENGQDLDEIECKKNPGHRDFIPFKDLTLEHLPNEHRNKEIFDKIKHIGSLVARLVWYKTVNGEQKPYKLGSGSVVKVSNEYYIKTNNHVVKTEDDVKDCTVEFHYDDDKDKTSVLTSTGEKLVYTCPFRDVTFFQFDPIHDFVYSQLDKMDEILPNIVKMYKDNQIVIDIATPTLIAFEIMFESFENLNDSLICLMFISWPNGSISYLKSSYFKFQPIPSNIQKMTSISVRIDEADGNSRVIPGDVVKFDDEYVVKIPESIFQDEVKKCRLVWNGKVIGCGTRLYFKQCTLKEIFSKISGVDLFIKQLPGSVCLFDFHPKPENLITTLTERSLKMCCVGHPHGAIKMVTFGRDLGNSQERFDIHGRRIAQARQDCRCKEVSCLKYSCKTCPGSSGSPVFTLYRFKDQSYCASHFMGEKVNRLSSDGEKIENQNIAWSPITYNF